MTEEEAELLKETQKKTGKLAQVGQVIRFWDEYVWLKEAKESGFYTNGEKKIYHSISFGPVLVDGGVARHYEVGEGMLMNHYRQPCSALGQTGPLEYVLVAVEGRTGESYGMKKNNLAQYMAGELGCQVAYSVDGGQSSTLIFHNKPFNTISNGGNERIFADIIYFATAIPEE